VKVALVLAAVAVAAACGFLAGRLTKDGAVSGDERPALVAEGELAALPEAPVDVRAERVVLPAGFSSRHRHGGPTFNFVDTGSVVIESDGRRVRYDTGDFFFEPAGRIHTIDVLDEARLRVIRLLPPGAEATTEVP
jgi:quercetin dioxygenase-like cupin family protein